MSNVHSDIKELLKEKGLSESFITLLSILSTTWIRERSIRFKAIFYFRKEHYRNNMDFISFSRIESDIFDAVHIYQPSVNHSSNNVNTNQVHDVHTKP